jgi:hypothetical protein
VKVIKEVLSIGLNAITKIIEKNQFCFLLVVGQLVVVWLQYSTERVGSRKQDYSKIDKYIYVLYENISKGTTEARLLFEQIM